VLGFQCHRVGVDRIRSIVFGVLRRGGQSNGQAIRGRGQKGSPSAVLVAVVDAALVLQGIVDVAGDVLVEAADAKGYLVAERQIQHGPHVAAVSAVIHALAVTSAAPEKLPRTGRW